MAFLKTITGCLCRCMTTRSWVTWFSALALFCSAAPAAPEQTGTAAEYQLKAVFLFNFAQFVEWPAKAFRDPKSPLVIGVLGDDPFGSYLDDLVSGEKVGERTLIVRRYRHAEDPGECHIVFICRSEVRDLDKIVARLKDRNVLTVGDVDTFNRQGGMVRFAMEGGKIRLRINVEAAKSCGLTISSKILRPGTIVTSAKD